MIFCYALPVATFPYQLRRVFSGRQLPPPVPACFRRSRPSSVHRCVSTPITAFPRESIRLRQLPLLTLVSASYCSVAAARTCSFSAILTTRISQQFQIFNVYTCYIIYYIQNVTVFSVSIFKFLIQNVHVVVISDHSQIVHTVVIIIEINSPYSSPEPTMYCKILCCY